MLDSYSSLNLPKLFSLFSYSFDMDQLSVDPLLVYIMLHHRFIRVVVIQLIVSS